MITRVRAEGRPLDAIGYAGAGALALADDPLIEALVSAIPGEATANNRFSTDAFLVAGQPSGRLTLEAALDALEECSTDNAAMHCLEAAGFAIRDLSRSSWARFDVDTPLDLALLRLGTRLPTTRRPDGVVAAFLEMTILPGGRSLEVPHLAGDRGDPARPRQAARRRRPHPVERLGVPRDGERLPGALLHRGARDALGARRRPALAAGRLDGAAGPGGPGQGARHASATR